jgi:anti-sigma B factor antagonist
MGTHHLLHERLDIRLDAREDIVVLKVSGACDLSCHEQLRERLLEAEALESQEVVVDLTGSSFIDSNGLRVLIGAWNRSRQAGHRFRVVLADSGQVPRVIEATGVHQVLPVATPEHA